jgi:hypothetical protein
VAALPAAVPGLLVRRARTTKGSDRMSEVTYLRPERQPAPGRAKAPLSEAAALDLDQAELFLLSLDAEMLTADGPRAAYLLGLAEGHLANLIQRIREAAR